MASQAITLPLEAVVTPEETAQRCRGLARNELDAAWQGDHLELLARRETELLRTRLGITTWYFGETVVRSVASS